MVQYKIRREGQDEPFVPQALTIIYPTTSWFKVVKYNDKRSAKISNLVYQAWICIYPSPKIIICDHSNELFCRVF